MSGIIIIPMLCIQNIDIFHLDHLLIVLNIMTIRVHEKNRRFLETLSAQALYMNIVLLFLNLFIPGKAYVLSRAPSLSFVMPPSPHILSSTLRLTYLSVPLGRWDDLCRQSHPGL